MKKRTFFLIGGLVLGLSGAYATGLSTPFADVRVTDVPVGETYVVTHSAADGLLLQNLEGTPAHVRVNAFPPAATDLRGGAQAIPNIDWIQITPNDFTLPPHGRVICRVTLKIPSQKIYRGQEYQVMIWSRSGLPKNQGMGVSAGLISRLRFKTK